jgi:hypothetical protein
LPKIHRKYYYLLDRGAIQKGQILNHWDDSVKASNFRLGVSTAEFKAYKDSVFQRYRHSIYPELKVHLDAGDLNYFREKTYEAFKILFEAVQGVTRSIPYDPFDKPRIFYRGVKEFYLPRIRDETFVINSFLSTTVDIDIAKKRIFYKWYGPTCNEVLYTGGTLPFDWKSQIRNIMMDAYTSGVYKLTMYPHCHYYDDHGVMHTIDMYGCVEVGDPFIEAKYMDGIIHATAQFRLDETGELVNGRYNLGTMFKQSLGTHVKWGKDNMSFIYGEMFNA